MTRTYDSAAIPYSQSLLERTQAAMESVPYDPQKLYLNFFLLR